MNDLEKARGEIDEIDAALALLFEKRMQLCRGIAAYKKEAGLPVRDAARENERIAAGCQYIHDPELVSFYSTFAKSVIALSREYQEKLLAGF